jgi:hypothetical protein
MKSAQNFGWLLSMRREYPGIFLQFAAMVVILLKLELIA